jgi:hypothetical protein
MDLQEARDDEDDDLVVFTKSSPKLNGKQQQCQERDCKQHKNEQKGKRGRDERLKLRKTNESGIHQEVFSVDQARNHYSKHDDAHPASSASSSVAPSKLSSSSPSTRATVIETLHNNDNLHLHVSAHFRKLFSS